MIIGIDGNEANVEKKVGVSSYAYELLWQFYQIRNPKSEIRNPKQITNPKFQIYIKEPPRNDLPKEADGWRYRVVKPRKMWTQIGLPLDLYLHRLRPDVFFTPTHYAPRFCPIPSVISIMDLSYIHFPQMFKKSDLYQLKNWTAYSVKNAKKVLTISEASKNDIIRHYQIDPERVIVTYPGIKMESEIPSKARFASGGRDQEPSMENLKKYKIEGDYILFVGTLQPRKNIVRLIEAFSTLGPKLYTLVVVGKPGWLYEEIYEAPKKFKVEDRVKFLDYVPDEDLPALYQNALCFVLPSLYEGFGLPVLEAMHYGCPVVTSNVSSLPEAAGDAAIMVDPESTESIKEGIEKVLGDKSLREKLVKKGYEQVKKFSWEKCARETLKVLEEVTAN
ncbi:MAG: glycosyltransferase family 1 protein [bacterium]|nr:glycosyltransferase family 1 protein [bacterium]